MITLREAKIGAVVQDYREGCHQYYMEDKPEHVGHIVGFDYNETTNEITVKVQFADGRTNSRHLSRLWLV